MDTIHDSFAMWEKERFSSMADLEREGQERDEAFFAMYDVLRSLNPSDRLGLYFETQTADNESRKVLIVEKRRVSSQPSHAHIIVSDEMSSPTGIANRMIVGRSFRLRTTNKLIVETSCEVPKTPNGWDVGEYGFYLQKRQDDPVTYIRHGKWFVSAAIGNEPIANLDTRMAQRAASENLHGILTSLVQVEPIQTKFALSPSPPISRRND